MSEERDLLSKLDDAWSEDFKTNLQHYCDLAGQHIRKLRKEIDATHAEVVHTQDELGRLLHSAEAQRDEARKQLASARSTLERCRTVLGNMALENEGAIFNRWPINCEPLRSDARNLLPIIDSALTDDSGKEADNAQS